MEDKGLKEVFSYINFIPLVTEIIKYLKYQGKQLSYYFEELNVFV